jgi:TIR domain
MADIPINFPSYATLYSDTAKESRKELPPEVILALFDVIDKLAENPDAFPNWTRAISRDGRTRVYTHPKPALQITYEVDKEAHLLYLLHFVAPQVQVTKPVFISYSHKDAAWLEKLKMFLQPLEEQGLLRIWDDTDISPGSQWFEEIRLSLESARVAVFLITQNFLHSEFIGQKELPVLLEKAKNRGCVIFWIAVSSSTVADSELSQFQAANDPNQPLDTLPEPEQNRVLTSIYERMKEAVQ